MHYVQGNSHPMSTKNLIEDIENSRPLETKKFANIDGNGAQKQAPHNFRNRAASAHLRTYNAKTNTTYGKENILNALNQ